MSTNVAWRHVRAMYLNSCRGMAIIAFALPTGLLVSSYVLGWSTPQASISAYYHQFERNYFVGILVAVGAFLLLYPGYTRAESWLLKYAGVMALGVAFFPTAKGGDCSGPMNASIHGFCAVTFFVAICIVGGYLSRKTLYLIPNEHTRAKLHKRYLMASAIMLVSVVGAMVGLFVSAEIRAELCKINGVFWVEAFGVWGFAFFWFSRTDEVKALFDITRPS